LGSFTRPWRGGSRLHWKHNAQGSDGKIGNDFVEVKTLGHCSTTDKVQVKLSGNFSKLIVVKIDFAEDTRAA
jgi:hypothetical protein